ncbi:polysaccharide pyruvyl transferase family protein [Ornithinimicrobium cerasi]|uniref:polysaccharide pyruvyl transferase family protein n=1 Tax=Ornithinimicrobium cerasi TaxID=2248773 RepID=UPI000F007019|nr:polysaccharide pyruvyl transferase family protein [Ornithinimicrobium cerasi]
MTSSPDSDLTTAPGVVVGTAETDGAPAPGRDDIVVCSFYTDDDYYRGHAATLRTTLDRLGVAHELEEIHKPEGADWADMTRRKIGILAEACDRHPDKKVFWIDVDCSLLSLPASVADFTADIVGFQRGFSSPLTIGYANRTRFWEPCFFGIAITAAARRFIADAHRFEQDATIKATDDYFFEESWRANAERLSFQVLPSAAVLSKANVESGVVPFFSFGSSGNVEEFKHKVVQHKSIDGRSSTTSVAPRTPLRAALRGAKNVERVLPPTVRRPARRIADQLGLTHVLTRGGAVGQGGSPTAQRARLVRHMIGASQRGDLTAVYAAYDRLQSSGVLTPGENAAKQAADAFGHYATLAPGTSHDPVRLTWWARPFPGNFGDWLSPLVVSQVSGRSVTYVPPTAPTQSTHLVSVGSIGRFVMPRSIVVGTGVSSTDIELDPKARYISVRGPVTAQLLRDSGGPDVESFGDPGALLSRILPVERGATNGRRLLVRHFKHANVPLALPEDMDETGVQMSHPGDIEDFVRRLNQYDSVVTSAMHVMIACHSYGIPCALIGFEGLEGAVHGTGVKYGDYSRGVGLATVHEPTLVGFDLRRVDLDSLTATEQISPAVLDDIELAVREGVAAFLEDV